MTSVQERKLKLIQSLQSQLKAAIKEYKNLENFECLPIISIAPPSTNEQSQTDQTTPLTRLQQHSPAETTTSLDWKSVAMTILDSITQQESLILPPSQDKSVLKPSQPSTINEIREHLNRGLIQSLEQMKEAIGVLILASSLQLGPEDKEKRDKLVKLFDHLL